MCLTLPLLAFGVLPLFGADAVLHRTTDMVDVLRQRGPCASTFDVTATVTYVSTNNFNENANLAGRDDSGHALFRIESRSRVPTVPAHGDRVRFSGDIAADAYGRRFAVLSDAAILSHGPAPQPIDLDYRALLNTTNDFRLCRFAGTLMDAACQLTSRCWIMLTIGDWRDHVFATVPSADPDELDRLRGLIGSRISVTGICVPYDHSPRLQVGRLFKIASFDDIRPAAPADESSGALPDVSDLSVTRPADFLSLGRHRAVGHVIAVRPGGQSLLKTDRGEFVGLNFVHVAPLPRYGDRIEAVGLPETDLFKINLGSASWKPLPGKPFAGEKPEAVHMDRMLTRASKNRQRLYCGDYLGRAICQRGRVQDLEADESTLRLDVGSYVVSVDAGSVPEALDGLSVGCEAEVVGTCVLEIDTPWARAAIPRLTGFTLVVRTSRDITILARPSWWTPQRLSAVIGALFVVLLGVFVWNRSLKRQVERRSSELFEGNIARAAADLKVYERTRLSVELHDSLAQCLTGVSMEIDAAIRLSEKSDETANRHLSVASRSLKSCREELRYCLWDLRNETLGLADMETAIRQTLAPHLGNARLSVRFRVPREQISDNTAHAILRICRELAVNAVRHGRATHVKVAGSFENGKLLFSVADDGCGFDASAAPGISEGHYGLQGIRERVDAFEGQFHIETGPAGTKAVVTLNIPQDGETKHDHAKA